MKQFQCPYPDSSIEMVGSDPCPPFPHSLCSAARPENISLYSGCLLPFPLHTTLQWVSYFPSGHFIVVLICIFLMNDIEKHSHAYQHLSIFSYILQRDSYSVYSPLYCELLQFLIYLRQCIRYTLYKYFFPFCEYSFHSCDVILGDLKALTSEKFQFFCFVLYTLYFW